MIIILPAVRTVPRIQFSLHGSNGSFVGAPTSSSCMNIHTSRRPSRQSMSRTKNKGNRSTVFVLHIARSIISF